MPDVNLIGMASQGTDDEGSLPLAGASHSLRARGDGSVRAQNDCHQIDGALLNATESPHANVRDAAIAADEAMGRGNEEGDAAETTTSAMVHLVGELATATAAEERLSQEEAINIITSEVNAGLEDRTPMGGDVVAVVRPGDTGYSQSASPSPRSELRESVPSRGTLRTIISYLLGCNVLKNTIMPALLMIGRGAFKLIPPSVNVLNFTGNMGMAAATGIPSATGTVTTAVGIAPWVMVALGATGIGALGYEIYSIYNLDPEAVIGNMEEHRQFIKQLHKIGNAARAEELGELARQLAASKADKEVKIFAYKSLKLAVTRFVEGQGHEQQYREDVLLRNIRDILEAIEGAGPVGGVVGKGIQFLSNLNEAVTQMGDYVYFVPWDRLTAYLENPTDDHRDEILSSVVKSVALHPYPPSQGVALAAMAMREVRGAVVQVAGVGVGAADEALALARDQIGKYRIAWDAAESGMPERAAAAKERDDARNVRAKTMGKEFTQTLASGLHKQLAAAGKKPQGGGNGLRKKRRTKKKASIKSARNKSARKSTRKKSARKSKGSKRTYRRKPTLRKTRGVKRKSRKSNKSSRK
jgi:hypothetical protein